MLLPPLTQGCTQASLFLSGPHRSPIERVRKSLHHSIPPDAEIKHAWGNSAARVTTPRSALLNGAFAASRRGVWEKKDTRMWERGSRFDPLRELSIVQ